MRERESGKKCSNKIWDFSVRNKLKHEHPTVFLWIRRIVIVKLLTNLVYDRKWTPKKQKKIEKYPDLDRKLKKL